MEDTQKLLENIIKAIVNYPDEVKIEKVVDEQGILFRIWVNRRDMGLIIGRAGTNSDAIKLILRMVGYKSRSHIAIKIEEPET